MEHGSDQFCQVEPDVGDVYCHVFSHLQELLKPEETHSAHISKFIQGLKDEKQVQNDFTDGKTKHLWHLTDMIHTYGNVLAKHIG